MIQRIENKRRVTWDYVVLQSWQDIVENPDAVIETNSKGKGDGKDPDGGDAKVVFDEATKALLQKTAFDSLIQFYDTMK